MEKKIEIIIKELESWSLVEIDELLKRIFAVYERDLEQEQLKRDFYKDNPL